MSSLSSCKSISVCLMYSPGGCLMTLGQSFITIFCGATKMYHEVYLPSFNPLACRTQPGQRFDLACVEYGPFNHQHYASVTLSQEGQVLLHSSIPGFVPSRPTYGFEHVIKSFANQNMWFHLITMGTVLGFLLACWHNPL
jgi:hypothetical protein